MRKVEHESRGLRKRLAEANTELASVRKSQQDLHDKLDENAKRLESATTKGAQLESEVDELQEKLRCSICMDRPKDTVFACGHTCCGECASEWKKCYYNCKSERRQKPVKYSFGIYL
ncbi:E3 ubiquitin-protein ligase MIB2-like protein [Aphelenchoides avenae]|nr:E3 ubiquitin-protein ligase MIB2-like protein [Aphelenchus avenae]